MSIKPRSSLSQGCRSQVGRLLFARSENGWGWTRRTSSGVEPVTSSNIVNAYFKVIPVQFFHEQVYTRGFIGRVSEPGFPLHDERIVAFTMSDGDDFDFAGNICPAWRFVFGNGDLELADINRPFVKGENLVLGYGRIVGSDRGFGTGST